MADQKVSDLPALNGVDVDPADLLYIVDSSAGAAGSKKITVGQYQVAPYSAGTANGVMYLNGSNVVTTGSGLVFDGTNLGIGTSSPGEKLDVNGNINVSNGSAFTSTNALINQLTSKAGSANQFTPASISFRTGAFVDNGVIGFNTNDGTGNTEKMRLDASGNLGLGATPSAVSATYYKSFELGKAGSGLSAATVSLTSNEQVWLSNNSYPTYSSGTVWKYGNDGEAARYALESGVHSWYTAPSGTAGNTISFTQAMTLDADGDLGIGTTSPNRRLEVSETSTTTAGIRVNNPSGSNGTGVNTTVEWYNSANSMANISAFRDTNEFRINCYANGLLSFYTNNTERARITSGGDLLVGKTADDQTTVGTRVEAVGAITLVRNSATNCVQINKKGNAGDLLAFYYNDAAVVGTITNSSTNTAYNTTSDRRLKENIAPAPSASDVIDAIEIVSHDWKAAPDEHVKYGVIAQDLHAVAPQAVSPGDDGTEIERTWGVDYSKLVPMLIKEIQSLRARVAALEAQ